MLRRLFKAITIALLGMFLFNAVVLAAWEFMFPISIADNSSTTRTYYPVFLGFGGQVLVDSGKIGSNGTDTNMQIGATSIKYMMATGNVTAVIPNLPANGVVQADLYTGYSPEQSSFAIIPGNGGYVTVSDNASMEPGANFTWMQSAFVDTESGASKYLVNKADAFSVYVSPTVSQNITADIECATQTSTIRPNAAGDATAISTQFPDSGEHWDKVDEVVADNDTTYIRTLNAGSEVDFYNIETPSFTGTSQSNISVNVTYRFRGTSADTIYCQPRLKLGGNISAGTNQNHSSTSYTTYNEQVSRPGGGSWVASDFESLQVGVMLTGTGIEFSVLTQVYVTVTYTPVLTVTATGVTTGEHSVTARANNAVFELLVDDTNLLYNSSFEVGNPSTSWSLYGAGASYNQSAAQAKVGTYSCILTRSGNDCNIFQSIPNYSDYIGTNVTCGAWVYATEASRARVVISDDHGVSNSSYHTGDSTWQWLSVTRAPTAGITFLNANVGVYNSDTSVYIDGIKFVQANSLASTLSFPSTVAFSGSTADNANNWVFMQNSVMPYADNITLYVGGTQQLYLAPNIMISGTNIPDRSLNSHNGTITWGSSANVTILYGEMESYESYAAESSNVTGGYDFPESAMPSRWFTAGENVSALPFYDSFSAVSVQTGQPVQQIYALGIIGLAFGAFMLIVVFTRSALLAYVAMTGVFGIGASMTIIPAWIIFALIVVGAGIMYLYRQMAY